MMQKRLGLDLEIPNEFGWWLAGFADGEGSFMAQVDEKQDGRRRLHLEFEIQLRADDHATLVSIRDMLGIGYLGYRKPRKGATKGANPTWTYRVRRVGDLYHVIIPLFEKFSLKSRKAKDFEVWKEVVRLRHELGFYGNQYQSIPEQAWIKLDDLAQKLKGERAYSLKDTGL